MGISGGGNEPIGFLTDTVYEMLDQALQLGMPYEAFWSYSFAEIADITKAKREQKRTELQERYCALYELADVIANRISIIFSQSNDAPERVEIMDVHPELFGISQEEAEQERMKKEAIKQAESRRQFANRWNPILRKKYGFTQTTSRD